MSNNRNRPKQTDSRQGESMVSPRKQDDYGKPEASDASALQAEIAALKAENESLKAAKEEWESGSLGSDHRGRAKGPHPKNRGKQWNFTVRVEYTDKDKKRVKLPERVILASDEGEAIRIFYAETIGPDNKLYDPTACRHTATIESVEEREKRNAFRKYVLDRQYQHNYGYECAPEQEVARVQEKSLKRDFENWEPEAVA